MKFDSIDETETETSPETGEQDLLAFLRMAAARLRKQTQALQETEGFSDRVRTMRMLEELIREQTPNENIGSSTGPAR